MKAYVAQERDAGRRIAAWLAAVDEAAAGGWTEIADTAAIPAQARADAEHGCDALFTAAANPHDAPAARRALHRGAVHLIRHEYEAGGLALTVFEGRNFVLVRVAPGSLDLLALPPGDRPAAMTRVAAALFRDPPRFDACEALGEGTVFCSEPRDPLRHGGRVDGGMRGGALWFLAYRRPAQRLGFAAAGQWLDE